MPDEEEWKNADVSFQIFDSPTMKGVFEDRQKEIKKIINDICKSKPNKKCPLKYTKQIGRAHV